MIYVEVTVRCFVKDSWCQADSKSKLLSILVIIVFSLIIGLRLQCYNPVHDSLNALAMYSCPYLGNQEKLYFILTYMHGFYLLQQINSSFRVVLVPNKLYFSLLPATTHLFLILQPSHPSSAEPLYSVLMPCSGRVELHG